MHAFHAWAVGDAVLDGELGIVEEVRRTRWGTPSARVAFPSGTRTLTPPREGIRASVLDRAVIARFVSLFYARVAEDDVLGPVFASRVRDWPHHVERLTSFWASVLLREGSFHGAPGPLHRAIAELEPRHFDRWLTLFGAVLEDVCDVGAARVVLARAEAMRTGLSAIVFGHGACS
jgi:hemoglobin